jgi:hypothetical protein
MRDRLLKIVSVLTGDAHLRVLDLRLHLELRGLDSRHDRAGRIAFDAFLDLHQDARAALWRSSSDPGRRRLQSDLSLDERLVEDIERGVRAVLARRADGDDRGADRVGMLLRGGLIFDGTTDEA